MSKAMSGVIGGAATGIACRSFHKYWSDCNPIRPQMKTWDQVNRETWAYIRKAAQSRRRIENAIKNGARILS